MNIIILIILTTLPAILIGKYIYKNDTNKKNKTIIKSLIVFGAIVAIISAIIEYFVEKKINIQNIIIFQIINNMIVVSVTEELAKMFVTYKCGIKKNGILYSFDAILYSSFAALGFATFENLFYVLKGGFTTAILRTIYSVPGHTAFGILMGYFIGQAYIEKNNNNLKNYKRNLFYSLLIPIIWHGLSDFAVSYGTSCLNVFMLLVILIFDFIYIIYCLKIVKKSAKENVLINNNINNSIIKNLNTNIQENNNLNSNNENDNDNDKNKAINNQSKNRSNLAKKFLIYELILIILLAITINFNLINAFGIHSLNESINIKEDNSILVVKSFENTPDNQYVIANITIKNLSIENLTLDYNNFYITDMDNKKQLYIDEIDTKNIFPLIIEPNQKYEFKLYIKTHGISANKYCLIYVTNNGKKEYGVMNL